MQVDRKQMLSLLRQEFGGNVRLARLVRMQKTPALRQVRRAAASRSSRTAAAGSTD